MGFPSTPVLDSFTRGDAESLGAGWGENVAENHTSFGISSNVAVASEAFRSNYWNAAQFTDVEAFFTITQMVAASEFRIVARLVNPNNDAAVDYYSLNADTTNSFLTKTVNGTLSQLGENLSVVFATGDGIGISVAGDTIKAFRKQGSGAWTEIASRTDSDIAGPGYIGFLVANDTSLKLDNFGGGSSVPVLGGPGAGGAMFSYYFRDRR